MWPDIHVYVPSSVCVCAQVCVRVHRYCECAHTYTGVCCGCICPSILAVL
jgi:hypothetical protein